MTSTFSLVILYFLLILLTTLFFDQASCKVDFVKHGVEGLTQFSNSFPKNSVTIVHNKTRLVDRTFIFPGISSPNVSIQNSEADIRSFIHHTGYYPIQHSYGARMYYFFFESRRTKSDPVILWLAGGPGAGCAVDLFYSNGPFHINNDLSLKWNDFGWDKISNLLYVDQPIGAGFSYSSDYRDIRRNTNEVTNDLYNFLQAFFHAHLEFVKNDFYITGHSYAGHSVPLLASRLQKENKDKEGIHINIKGLAIGNGLMSPRYQYSSYHDFALANKLISKSDYYRLRILNIECVKSIHNCELDDNTCWDSYHKCSFNFHRMLHIIGNINIFDIRKKRTDPPVYDLQRIDKFLALDSVRTALNVGSRPYVFLNPIAFHAMTNDFMKNYAIVIPSLLEDGIKVLIFDGEYDLACNWLGNLRWLDAMKWSGQRQFWKTKITSYEVGDEKVGDVRSTGPLTYLKVHNAGHNVAADQPRIALQMLKNWMSA